MAEKNKLKIGKQNNPFPTMEEEVLDFWDKSKIFEKSVKKKAPKGDYVFYDGPPFGTGEPHYGHILSSVSKDVVPRYWTMRGYRVERRWGWDCHGLPIENIIEEQLKINGKKEIEKMGIDKFNESCRSQVLKYADIWGRMVRRIGRWIEFESSYKTMNLDYMESVWWAFKELWNKDLIYKGRKVLLYCPRCETPISNFEVAMDNSYQDITEESVYVKFKVVNNAKLRQLGAKLRQDDNVYVLAWTTTPWTLPGNVALAVGKEINYVLIREQRTTNNEHYILAKDRMEEVMSDIKYEVVKELKGKDLVGLEYESLFDVPALKNSGKKVYCVAEADFVTTEEGTGVVHTAVVYGEDDYNLGLKLDLPVVPALDEKGYFNDTVPQFKGVYFKKADKMIIKDLEKRNLVFKKEQTTHSYPFCHRCATQLFYNAIPAWFLSIEKIRKQLLKQNKKINWFPKHLKEGRFAQGIEQAPDWNISRNRYFATPMPIWECDGKLKAKSKKLKVVLIHGNGRGNFYYSWQPYLKKELGKFGIEVDSRRFPESEIAPMNVWLPFLENKIGVDENTVLVGHSSGAVAIMRLLEKRKVKGVLLVGAYHTDLGDKTERKSGYFNTEWQWDKIRNNAEWIIQYASTGDPYIPIEEADYVHNKLKTIYYRYDNQGHFGDDVNKKEFPELLDELKKYLLEECNEMEIISSVKELEKKSGKKNIKDIHSHFIDNLTWKCKCGGTMKRIKEVFDCWVESGSMSFAQMHYPFENKEKFEKIFPAQFISEYISQTRAWFYVMHVMSVALFNSNSFENVVTTGVIFNEKGEKMSKSKNNFPDPWKIINEYGVDALRFYLMSSSLMHAENLFFNERELRDVFRKNVMLLWNVYKFYEMFAKKYNANAANSMRPTSLKLQGVKMPRIANDANILDRWILARLNELIKEVTDNMDNYDLPRATRPITEFIDDLSTWYLRRSRDRFKSGEQDAIKITSYVLLQLSKLIAPFMPFMAEQLWQKVTGNDFKDKDKSVHLENWPQATSSKQQATNKMLGKMEIVRKIVELGLAKRDEAGIRVRQPLNQLRIKNCELRIEYENLIKDELNVKNVVSKKGRGELEVELITELTLELIQEGVKRELVRFINALRKEVGLTIQDRIKIFWHSEDKDIKKAIKKYGNEIIKDTLADEIQESVNDADIKKEVKVNDGKVVLGVKKIT